MSKTSPSRLPVQGISLFFLGVLSLLGVSGPAYGQQSSPAPSTSIPAVSPAATAPAVPATAASPAPPKPASADAAALDYLYNRKPQDGSVAGAAAENKMRGDDRTRALDALAGADSPLEPEFEQYLNAAEADPAKLKAYLAAYDKVVALLLQKKPADAYQALFAMAAYEGDAGIARQLANRVQTVYDADQTTRGILAENDRLQQQVRRSNWNIDQYAADDDRRRADRAASQHRATTSGKNNGGALPADNGGNNGGDSLGIDLTGKARMTEEYLGSLDGKARIKLNEVRIKGVSDKSKAEFADYISTLYNSGRLFHTVVAADFYRVLFQDGSLPGPVANQADAASEIVRRINQAAEVIRFKISAGQLSSASALLHEAFKVNHDHPALQRLERASKLKVAAYYELLKRMQNLIEAREFGGLEALIAETQKMAKDFDGTKALALVNAVKLESRMHLGQAKLAAQQGDQQKALDEFKAAATAWPGNPDLTTASNGYFESQDNKNKGVAEFDRAITEGNFRAVYDNQLPFLAAVRGDAEREKKFKAALEKVRDAEMATEKANLLARNGDNCGAWEALEAAAKGWPDDGKLNKMRAEMSIKATEFVSAINKAQEAETRKELGYSLTLYVQAQRRYPASQVANEAITRLSAQVLGNKPLAANP